jgi:protein xylosyltransferase
VISNLFICNNMCMFIPEFRPVVPKAASNDQQESVRIIFLLTLNGRALRQVNRLINALYRKNHYIFIHVDKVSTYNKWSRSVYS